MDNLNNIRNDVISVLDILSPLDLVSMSIEQVVKVQINYTSGFDESMKRALAVPFSKISRKYGKYFGKIGL